MGERLHSDRREELAYSSQDHEYTYRQIDDATGALSVCISHDGAKRLDKLESRRGEGKALTRYLRNPW